MMGDVGEVAYAVLRRAASRYAARVCVKTLRLDVREGAQGVLIHASYVVRSLDPGSTAPLLMDARVNSPEIRTVRCDKCRQTPWMSPRRRLLAVPFTGLSVDEDRTVEVVLEWRPPGGRSPGDHAEVLVLPDALPNLLGTHGYSASNGRQAPVMTMGVLDGTHDLRIVGASSVLGGTAAGRDRDWLQAVVTSRGHLVEGNSHLGGIGVLATKGFTSQYPESKVLSAFELTQNIVRFLGAWFGSPLPAEPVLALERELVSGGHHPYGLVLTPTRWELGVDDAATEPADFNLAFHAAGIWWGLGCRLRGPDSGELEAGLAATAALAWTGAVSTEGVVARQVTRFRRFASGSSIRDTWAAAAGRLRMRRVARVVLAIHQALQENAEVHPTIVRLTRSSWGRVLEQSAVLEQLAQAGVTIPL